MTNKNKVINAGYLVKTILEIAESNNKIVNGALNLTENELDEILFSLGFPESNTTLNIEW